MGKKVFQFIVPDSEEGSSAWDSQSELVGDGRDSEVSYHSVPPMIRTLPPTSKVKRSYLL